MKPVARILLYVVLAFLVIVLLCVLIGLMLPKKHKAVVEGHYRARPTELHAAISDVDLGPSWRTGVKQVQVLSRPEEPLRWREVTDWGTLTMVQDVNEPNRIVARILDEGQGWGGTWTYEISPDGTGTIVRITEDGVVTNPLYRFMSRYVMGYYKGLETYIADLGRRFGETVEPMRVRQSH